LALALSFAYCSYACWRQYRHGEHHRAWTLAFGLALLLGFVLFDRIANAGFLESAHLAQFGFVALVVVMGVALFRDLGEADRRMQSVLDNVPAVIFLKDFAGRYVFVNRRFEERFGVSAADAAGHTDFELFPKAQAEAGEESDCLVLKNRTPLAFDEVAHHDGRSRTYFTLKFPLLDEGREAYGVGCVSTDVTEARAAVEEARMLRQQVWHAERVIRVSAMGASLAHELSQPLTAILSNAQAGLRFLAKEDFNPGEFQELLRDVVRDAGRASSLISGLRNMLRKKELPRERLDLAETAAEALKLLNQELLERSIEYRTELEAGCAVLAAKAQLQQVLLNLLMNAAEAVQNQAAGRRRVTVAVSTTPAGVARVMIRDTGVGIPADELRGVFDAFYSTKPTGIGMGLAVCRAIIDTHGGKIWAERNEDGGATIVFTLPLALEARALATGLAPSDQVAQASPA
jgi:PAS domain S-box-containing protein